MKEVNFLEAVEALRDGKCKEIEIENGVRYYMKDGIIKYLPGEEVVFLSPEIFLGKWELIGVKKKVVIEDVKWRTAGGPVIPFQDSQGPMELFSWREFLACPKMKMTLEWEEEGEVV